MALPEPAPLAAPLTTTHRVISYTYDALYRLTEAEYSTGESFAYTYDAVGNRLSLTTYQGVVNYAYDDANRLTSVNGQAYTWDNNGNLLSDSLRSYSYDRANRLTQVVSGTLTTGFTYNGAGDRVAKTVDGVTTDYVLDGSTGLTTGPAAGLPQVLQETTNGQTTSYLYGADLLAQYDSGTWAYHVNDGLGSVRGLADSVGQVVGSYSFSPFGVPLGESGGEPYGYTGEQWDAEVELLYLRARYMQPTTGRFVSKDPWPGDVRRPRALNGWSYVENNPINATDPSGAFVPGPVWELLSEFPAGVVVASAKAFYCKAGPLRICFLEEDDGQWPWDTVDDLVTHYVCEYGPEHRVFFADAHLTQQLAWSMSIHHYREEFYRGGGRSLEGRHVFGEPEFLEATIDSLLRGEETRFVLPWPKMDITHFLGTYDYKITQVGSDWVRFEINNRTDLASGTRIPPRYGGIPPEKEAEALSVEELLLIYPSLSNQKLGWLVDHFSIISILRERWRTETPWLMGGGVMEQTFIWYEPYPLLGSCIPWLPPWPVVLPFLRIEDPFRV